MSTRQIKSASTDQSVNVRIIDSGDGTPETGVTSATSGLDFWYRREGAAKVSLTESDLSALTDAHSDGGLLHISDGDYRVDWPDAAFAAGVTGVQLGGTVTGMVVLAPYVELVAYDPYDTVRLGLTALPNAVAEAAGGLYTRGTGAGQINQAANGMVDTNPVRLNNVSQSLLDLKDFADDGYDPTTDKVQGVVTVDTTTTNSDMRGTDGASTHSAAAVWAVATRVLTANTNLNDPTAAAIRSEIDSNSTQLAAIVADTNELQTDDIPGLIAALNNVSLSQIFTTALTESYAAEGSTLTLAQFLYEILQFLKEKSVVGTTVTSKKLDQSTTAATYTLDDDTTPTSITRAT